jgi:hypothetical protein
MRTVAEAALQAGVGFGSAGAGLAATARAPTMASSSWICGVDLL